MAHLFLSYHHADVDFAFQIHAQLERAGFAIDINPDPEAGITWAAWTDPLIRSAFVHLPLLTPASRASEIIAYEWAYACGAGVPIIPLVAAGVIPHPRLAALESIVFTDAAFPWDALLARVYQIALAYSQTHLTVPPDAPPAVLDAAKALHSPEFEDRAAALDTLAHLDDPAARELLIAAVRHPIYCDVRMTAVEKLAQARTGWAMNGLLAALYDDDWDVMRAASQALVPFGNAAVPGLLTALHSTTRGAWSGAVWALAGIQTPACVPGLIDALRLRGWFGPRSAAVVLGEIGDPRAIPALTEALNSDDESLVALAQEALRKLEK